MQPACCPPDAAELRALPGIGAYTAGAVSSFAYERRAELVDTNVARVIKRVFAPDVDLKSGRGQKRVWRIARELLPRTGTATWTHNQALMELGALVCTARIAHCGACPVRSVCASYARHAPSAAERGVAGGRPTPPASARAHDVMANGLGNESVPRPFPARSHQVSSPPSLFHEDEDATVLREPEGSLP